MTSDQQDYLRRRLIAADFIVNHLTTLEPSSKEAALNLEQLVAIIADAKSLLIAAKDTP